MKLSILLTRRERLLGWSYLLISLFVMPSALELLNTLLAKPLSDTVLNLIFFAVNFLAVCIVFHRFLLASVKLALAKPLYCLRIALIGFAFYYCAMLFISRGIRWFYPNFSNVNDSAIADLSKEYTSAMAFATVFLVPITEETFYRGLIFQGLYQKNRSLAYCLSTLVFAGIHIMGYIGLSDWQTLLLCFVQYLPAGLALAWSYEKTDTIITPILIHIIVNQIGLIASR